MSKPVPPRMLLKGHLPAKALLVTPPGSGLPWEPVNPSFPDTIALYLDGLGYITPVRRGEVRVEYETAMGGSEIKTFKADWEFKTYTAVYPSAWGKWGDVFSFAASPYHVESIRAHKEALQCL